MNSLTIWKADINIGIYVVTNGVALNVANDINTNKSEHRLSQEFMFNIRLMSTRHWLSYQVTHPMSSDMVSTWKCQTLQLVRISLRTFQKYLSLVLTIRKVVFRSVLLVKQGAWLGSVVFSTRLSKQRSITTKNDENTWGCMVKWLSVCGGCLGS